jgi:hypothetical protein
LSDTLQSKATDTFREMNDRMNAIKAELKERGSELFKEAMADYFAKNPVVSEVQFGGYTPFFNDGDECVFGMVEYLIKINGRYVSQDCAYDNEDEFPDEDSFAMFETKWGTTGKTTTRTRYDGTEYESPVYDHLPNPTYDPKWGTARQDLLDLISSVDDSTFKDIFGSHFLVTATPNSVEVDEYTDHD